MYVTYNRKKQSFPFKGFIINQLKVIMINFLDIKYVTVKDSEKGLDHVLINYMKLKVGEDSGKVSTHI